MVAPTQSLLFSQPQPEVIFLQIAYTATPHQLHCCPVATLLEEDTITGLLLDELDAGILDAGREEVIEDLLDAALEIMDEDATDVLLDDTAESHAPIKVHSAHGPELVAGLWYCDHQLAT